MIGICRCDECDNTTLNREDEYGEIYCADCLQDRAEAAYERHCEAFHDGGSTQFVSPQQRQIDAQKLK
jgi:transcription initiation factor TFIIIB Brf1 subunit/transcription initiation factor TFIIB